LDALIAYAVTEQYLADNPTDDSRLIRSIAEELPLQRECRDDKWVWKSSALLPEGLGEHYMRMWTRKTDAFDYAERVYTGSVGGARKIKLPLNRFAMKIDTVRGVLKNAFQFYPVREVEKLIGYCVVDTENEAEQLIDLLDPDAGFVTHIGSRKRVGHGRVTSLEVEEDQTAMELWKMRLLPWEEDGYSAMQAAVKPPYWAAENRTIAYCPPEILL
jgi:CRISPR type IV-associated protein Csf3